MGEECRFGLMALAMKVIGVMIRRMEEAGSFTQTVMCMKANGKTTNLTDMECICIQTGLSTRENGSRINKKAMGLRLGLMVPSTRGAIKTG